MTSIATDTLCVFHIVSVLGGRKKSRLSIYPQLLINKNAYATMMQNKQHRPFAAFLHFQRLYSPLISPLKCPHQHPKNVTTYQVIRLKQFHLQQLQLFLQGVFKVGHGWCRRHGLRWLRATNAGRRRRFDGRPCRAAPTRKNLRQLKVEQCLDLLVLSCFQFNMLDWEWYIMIYIYMTHRGHMVNILKVADCQVAASRISNASSHETPSWF